MTGIWGLALQVSIQLTACFLHGRLCVLVKWHVAHKWHKTIKENLHSAVCTLVETVSHVAEENALFQQLFSEALLCKEYIEA